MADLEFAEVTIKAFDEPTANVGMCAYEFDDVTYVKSAKINLANNPEVRSCAVYIQYSDDESKWTTAYVDKCESGQQWLVGRDKITDQKVLEKGCHKFWRYVEGEPISQGHPLVNNVVLEVVS